MLKATLILAFSLLVGGVAVSGESFTGYDEHGNQVHVVDGRIVSTTPRAAVQPPTPVQPARRTGSRTTSPRLQGGVGHGPTGRLEYNPYDPRKWFRDTTGMIDQINRDYPPAYPRSR